MKKIMSLILVALLAGTSVANAQLSEEARKERKQMRKMAKSELKEKATKAARDEAKRLKKAGWQVAPGALPIEKQLDRSYIMQSEFDDDGFPKFIMGESTTTGGNYDAAKLQATALAKQDLAGKIQTEVEELIENKVENKELGPEEAVSATKTVSAGKQRISQNIGRTITIIEMYRELKNKNKEVRVQIAYSAEYAKRAAKNAVRDELEKEGDELGKKLDAILGW